MAVCSIVYIFQVLDTECVQYLPNVIPVMLRASVRTADDALHEAMFKELASLVSVIKAHIRRCRHLGPHASIVGERWNHQRTLSCCVKSFQFH